ncbi:uncharacterized protein LOC141700996 [Apium graveolens]|uniref:uncharacterized protein LOC141700996 n=1 Tax=Apium graveolens TaxID=4045 RepID=UPI003D78C3EF
MARECKSSGPIQNLMSVATISASVPTEVLALPSPSEPVPQASTRTFNLKMKDIVQNLDVIAGKLSINNVEAKVLIDSGATRSFIFESFAGRINCDKKDMNEVMSIVISNQEKVHVSQLCPECEIDISGHKLKNGMKVVFKGQKQEQLFLTAVQASKLLRKDCEAFLTYVVDSKKEVPSIEAIPVVREFPNVFPEELSGLPPD